MSIKNEPSVLATDNVEDTQTIGDVIQMYNKFLRNIDQFRSIAASPNLGANTYRSAPAGSTDQDNVLERANFALNVDPENFLESRAHAFYRMVGFPVASSEVYYNSGHDPDQINTVQNRRTVNSSLQNENPDAIKLSQNRENNLKQRLVIFNMQDELSSIYALILPFSKPFLMAKVGQGPFDNDPQIQPIAGRKEQLQLFRTNNIVVPKFVTDPDHILKPFIVNPDIESAVTEEYKRRICVPFLADKVSTRTTQEDYLKRPIIEYIIRQRLKISEPNTGFIESATRLINGGLDVSASSGDDNVKSVLQALSGDNIFGLNSNFINGLTSVQTSTILMFTKAIRVAVAELDTSIRKFKDIRASLTIQPIPNVQGPEFGGTIRTISTIEQQSETDKQIAILELVQILSEDQSTIDQDDVNRIGNNTVFASSDVADISKNFTPNISKLSKKRDAFGRDLIQSLRIIEIVTGEIAGIGLVDVLAIYTALWAIDMRHLIGLLDNRSLQRLNDNFPKLVNDEIQSQLNGSRPSITETLEAFEKIFFNVLTYADKVFTQSGASPRRARKGSIT